MIYIERERKRESGRERERQRATERARQRERESWRGIDLWWVVFFTQPTR